ncbi:MAG: DUF3592 domain-containing protein [Candidatus Obscuribacterales bacterium]|nr:DUF3592 domain-containing protein [Candidatus Obscuribacterales bacterium]
MKFWQIKFFLATFVVLGLGGIYCTFQDLLPIMQASTWPSATGTVSRITKEDINSSPRRAPSIEVIVYYDYNVSGKSYSGKQGCFFDFGSQLLARFHSVSDADKIEASFPKGAARPVFYNPSNPGESFIDRNITYPGIATIIFVSFVTLLIIGGAISLFLKPGRLN